MKWNLGISSKPNNSEFKIWFICRSRILYRTKFYTGSYELLSIAEIITDVVSLFTMNNIEN